MAVFTEVSESSAQELLTQLKLGELVELKGIQGGIENTNYFLTSSEGRTSAAARPRKRQPNSPPRAAARPDSSAPSTTGTWRFPTSTATT